MADFSFIQTGQQLQSDINLIENGIGNTFNPSSTYVIGDLVIYNDKLWKCHTAITIPSTWTGIENWTETKIADELKNSVVVSGGTEVITKATELPTATETSPDLVEVDGNLYYKKVNKSGSSNEELTDLTGTTWIYNEDSLISYGTIGAYFSIDFISNNEEFNDINFNNWWDMDGSESFGQHDIMYGGEVVASGDGQGALTFTNDNYKTITITGGNDVTNSELIYFIEESYTQVVEEVAPYEYVLIATNESVTNQINQVNEEITDLKARTNLSLNYDSTTQTLSITEV